MTDDEDDLLVAVAGEVADGRDVDWRGIDASASAEQIEDLRQLRAIAEIARIHRNLPEPAGELASVGSSTGLEAPAPPAGPRWGPLVVLEQVGAGSYGEVFRAWDTTLAREVALKLLRRRHRGGADSIIREGQLLARVSHPNVMAVHGAREIDGQVGVWGEFLRGRTLARLVTEEGPFSADEALVIADSICRALAAAHRAGLLHRDVKAHNVIRERGGRIVLMDFGLGRQVVPNSADTNDGRLAGTPLYAAPELFANGRATIQCDIYSLGVLMFFLVTGTYPITGRTIEEVAAAHAAGRRTKLQDLRPELPTAFVQVVEHALEPDPAMRFASAGEMQAAVTAASRPLRPREPSATGLRALAHPVVAAVVVGAVIVSIALTAWVATNARPAPAVSMTRLIEVGPPPGTRFGDSSRSMPAISPDGRHIAFSATTLKDGKIHLWLHSLETGTAKEVRDSELALAPFWAPDSRSLGFLESGNGIIKHTALDGVPTIITTAGHEPRGATLNGAGLMLFPKGPRSGLFVRSVTDPDARDELLLDRLDEELGYMWPQFLPDGDRFIYFVLSNNREKRGIYLSSLSERGRVRLIASDASATVVGDRLLFVRNGDLLAWRFSATGHPRVDGPPTTIAQRVATNYDGHSVASAADNGTLVYMPARDNTELVWFDRQGRQGEKLDLPAARYRSPALSSDGRYLAVQVHRDGLSHIEVFDQYETTPKALRGLDHSAGVQFPVWGPEHRLAYSSVDRGQLDIYVKDYDDDDPGKLLYPAPQSADDVDKMPTDWSRDGRSLLFVNLPRNRRYSVWKLTLDQPGDKPRRAAPLRAGEGTQVGGRLSPDGRQALYVRRLDAGQSGKSPERELWVCEFPCENSVHRVTEGGIDPAWLSMSEVSFFDQAGRFTILSVPGFAAAAQPNSFAVGVNTPQASRNNYAWSPDGSRVLVNRPAEDSTQVRLIVVMNGR